MGKKFNFFCFAEYLFFCHSVNFYGRKRVTLSLPKEGGNPTGVSP
jgi:hypothetical protein